MTEPLQRVEIPDPVLACRECGLQFRYGPQAFEEYCQHYAREHLGLEMVGFAEDNQAPVRMVPPRTAPGQGKFTASAKVTRRDGRVEFYDIPQHDIHVGAE